MKRKKALLKNLKVAFLFCLGISTPVWTQEKTIPDSTLVKSPFSSKPLQEVVTLGAATTGPLVAGNVGSIDKGCRHRFYCRSASPLTGFLGPQTIAKPLTLKDQPGIFPAPLMGEAVIAFNFRCQESQTCITPVIVRPDGTIFQGHPMTILNSPQTLVIPSPAQIGIYTLFVLAHRNRTHDIQVTVEASINTQPQNNRTFHLKTFKANEKNAELISADFVYLPQPY